MGARAPVHRRGGRGRRAGAAARHGGRRLGGPRVDVVAAARAPPRPNAGRRADRSARVPRARHDGRAAAAAAHAAARGQLERRRALRCAGGGGARHGGGGRQLRPGIGGGAARVARAHRGLRQRAAPLWRRARRAGGGAAAGQPAVPDGGGRGGADAVHLDVVARPAHAHPLRLGSQRLRAAHRAQTIRAVGAEPDGAPLPVPTAPSAVAQVARRLRGARHLAAAVRQLLARRGDRRRRGT